MPIQKNHYYARNGSFSQVLSHVLVNMWVIELQDRYPEVTQSTRSNLRSEKVKKYHNMLQSKK